MGGCMSGGGFVGGSAEVGGVWVDQGQVLEVILSQWMKGQGESGSRECAVGGRPLVC